MNFSELRVLEMALIQFITQIRFYGPYLGFPLFEQYPYLDIHASGYIQFLDFVTHLEGMTGGCSEPEATNRGTRYIVTCKERQFPRRDSQWLLALGEVQLVAPLQLHHLSKT